jgi:ATP-binding cassette, subfamily F, member 2
MHLTKKRLTTYTGNYDSFVQTKGDLEEEQMKVIAFISHSFLPSTIPALPSSDSPALQRYKWEQDEIKKMKDYVAKFGHGTAKNAKQAQSKEKTLDKMVRSGLTDKVEIEKAMDFQFPSPGPLAPPVLQCTDIAFGYPGTVSPFSCELSPMAL